MRQHAAQFGALARLQHAADVGERGVTGLHAGTVAVAVDLDQCRETQAQRLPLGRHRPRGVHVVEQDLHVRATAAQIGHVVELAGRDAHGVEDVGEAVGEELLSLFERGNGDRTRPIFQRHAHDFDALGRLDVRPQRDAESGEFAAHPCEIALHLRPVEDQRRRFEQW